MTSNDLSESLKSSFTLFKKYLLKIIILAILIYVPVSIIQIMIPQIDLSGMTADNISLYYDKVLIMLLSSVILSIFSGIFDMAVIYLAGHDDRNGRVSLAEAFDFSIKKFPKYLVTRIISYAICFMLAMLCFLPGIIALFLFSLSIYVIVLRDKWGRKALKESSVLVRKNLILVMAVTAIELILPYGFIFVQDLIVNIISKANMNELFVDIIWTVMNVLIYTLLSIIIIFICLLVIKMINNSPELNKDREPEQ